MNFILDLYKDLPDNEKNFSKELLEDILNFSEIQDKNKGKKSIHYEEIFKIIKKSAEIGATILVKEGIKEIDEEELSKIIYGIGKQELNDYKILFLFPVYKGEFNNRNNAKFVFRRKFINLLDEKRIIEFLDFNLIKEFKNIINCNYEEYPELISLCEYYKEVEQELRKNYGDDLIENDLKNLNNAEKKFENIRFKTKNIEKLLEEIENIENKNLIYKDRTLYYLGKKYNLSKNSKRERFISLFFERKEKCISKRKIINYLQFDTGDFYNEKTRKSLLDLYKGINRIIEEKLGIKDLFYLGEGDNEGKICIKI